MMGIIYQRPAVLEDQSAWRLLTTTPAYSFIRYRLIYTFVFSFIQNTTNEVNILNRVHSFDARQRIRSCPLRLHLDRAVAWFAHGHRSQQCFVNITTPRLFKSTTHGRKIPLEQKSRQTVHQLPIRLPPENTRRVARISQRKPRQLATGALNALMDNGWLSSWPKRVI